MNPSESNRSTKGQSIKACPLGQFEFVWQLLSYHLQTLTTEECLWRSAAQCLHIDQGTNGLWRSPHDVTWPGNADALREKLAALRSEWLKGVEELSDEDLSASTRTRWPLQDKPFSDIVACVNIELMKNTAELGYVRFLYAGLVTDCA